MDDVVYKPSENGEILVSEDRLSFIEPTPGLYFADQEPMLSFRNVATFPDALYEFYRAVRLETPTTVERVRIRKEFFDEPPLDLPFYLDEEYWPVTIQKTRVTLPAGSLLVRTFAESSSLDVRWYAYTPSQQNAQNLQRDRFDPSMGPFVLYDDFNRAEMGCSMLNNVGLMREAIKKFTDPEQVAAHLADIAHVAKLGLAQQRKIFPPQTVFKKQDLYDWAI